MGTCFRALYKKQFSITRCFRSAALRKRDIPCNVAPLPMVLIFIAQLVVVRVRRPSVVRLWLEFSLKTPSGFLSNPTNGCVCSIRPAVFKFANLHFHFFIVFFFLFFFVYMVVHGTDAFF